MADHNPFTAPTSGFKTGGGGNYNDYDDDDDYILADRGTRFAARLIDNLLSGVAAVPGIIFMFMVMGALSDADPDVAVLGIYGAAGVAMIGVLIFNIYQWYLISSTGQSLGKKWLTIRIVKIDNTPIDFVSGVLLREWVLGFVIGMISAVIPGVGNILGLVDALMIFGNERRCLHDVIASTRVVMGSYQIDDVEDYY